MAKPHEKIMEMTSAFDTADRNTPRDELGRARYEMAQTTGMPRSPAQMASVKKAAAKSALARKVTKAATAPAAPAPTAPSSLSTVPTGGIGLAARPKGGLLR